MLSLKSPNVLVELFAALEPDPSASVVETNQLSDPVAAKLKSEIGGKLETPPLVVREEPNPSITHCSFRNPQVSRGCR